MVKLLRFKNPDGNKFELKNSPTDLAIELLFIQLSPTEQLEMLKTLSDKAVDNVILCPHCAQFFKLDNFVAVDDEVE